MSRGRGSLDSPCPLWQTFALMQVPDENVADLVKNSVLYKEFLSEREEILRHKWIESEKAGRDIGFEKALLDWVVKHRASWRESRARALRARE